MKIDFIGSLLVVLETWGLLLSLWQCLHHYHTINHCRFLHYFSQLWPESYFFSPRKWLSIIYITSSPAEHMQIDVQNLTKAYWTSSGLCPDEKGIICLQSGIHNQYSHQHRLWPYLIHWIFWPDCPKGNEQSNSSDVDGNNAGRNHLGILFHLFLWRRKRQCFAPVGLLVQCWGDIVYWVFRPLP